MIVKVHSSAFLIGCRNDSESIHIMLDGLTFLH